MLSMASVPTQAGDLERGRWLFLDMSVNERFSFELDFEPQGALMRTQKRKLLPGGSYVARRYVDTDGRRPLTAILRGSISVGSTFSLLLPDGATFLSGDVSPDGKSMEGSFSDGSSFKAFFGGRYGEQMKRIYRLCKNSRHDLYYECHDEWNQQKGTSGDWCNVIPKNYNATYFDKRECEAAANTLNQ